MNRIDYLMGRDEEYPLCPTLENNLKILLERLNHFEKEYWNFSGRTINLSSGYRPGRYNVEAKGSKNSAHIDCRAVDYQDDNKAIKLWIMAYPQILDICNLYMEHPKYTPIWCHLSTRKASKRIYIPY